MYLFVYVLGFCCWYTVMREQTSGRGTRVYLRDCHLFVGKICIVVTTSAYIKHVSGFKISENTSLKNIIQKIFYY